MVLEVNGWKLLYHPVFGDRYVRLRARVRELKASVPAGEFTAHPDVKLVAAIRRAILVVIPEDPNRPDFWLSADLAAFRRVKGYGLPDRYRLYYVFSSTARTVIILYLNDSASLRKDAAKTDPYQVFARLVRSGSIGKDFDANLVQWKTARGQRGT